MRKSFAALLAGAMLLMATSAMATPINGSISFNGSLALTGPSVDTVAANATGVHFNNPAYVFGGKTGDFASVGTFTAVTFADFVFSPNLTPSPVISLWSFTSGSTTFSFDLTSVSSYNVPTNVLTLNGQGILHATGLDDTLGTWSLTTQDGVVGDLTFSSASTVPEPGTMVLLGFGMFGLAIYGKRRLNKEA